MQRLRIFVCENFYQEYKETLKQEEIDDVELFKFPSLCDHKAAKNEVEDMFSNTSNQQSMLICSKFCDALELAEKENTITKITADYCFSNLICDEFIDYLTAQGSYIISSAWLENWEVHLKRMGFDQKTAKMFFKESAKQLVLLDTGIIDNPEEILKELSFYLELPYLIVSVNLETVRLLLNSKIFEWRLQQQEAEKDSVINELRSKSADYSAVFDMLGKISSYTKKRDVIEKVKELFMIVFGAQKFKFWSGKTKLLPSELQEFKKSDANYIMFKNEDRFCIKVFWDGAFYGVLDVRNFLFPDYIDRYLNLALDITKFLGLVFHNNEQYEKVLESEKELKHLSFHDSMTGLYNRTYLNQLLEQKIEKDIKIVFMFDIDKLKYANDNFGHAEGDKLIKSFADVLKQAFRKDDLTARIGGDEFLAFTYEGNQETAKSIVKRINNLINLNNNNLKANHLNLNVSIGYAVNNNDQSVEELMKKADDLMYKNKNNKEIEKWIK